MNLVPDKLTAMAASDVLAAIGAALRAMGVEPSNSAIAILWAQSALETARWKSMHCYNFGNMRPPKDWPGDYCQFRCNEQTAPGKWVWYNPPDPGSNFLAFPDAVTGVRYWLEKLQARWPEAFQGALAGQPGPFVHGLKQRGYFTADEGPYLQGVLGLTHEALGLLQQTQAAPPAEHEPDWAAIYASTELGNFHPGESAGENLRDDA